LGNPLDTNETGDRALTLWRPWAQLVALGVKPVENRAKLHTKWRGRLFIHAGQRWDEVGASMGRMHGHRISEKKADTGYLAVATLTDVHRADDDNCSCDPQWAEPGVWHWCLSDVRRFGCAIPLPGRQGLFKPDEAAVEMARLEGLLDPPTPCPCGRPACPGCDKLAAADCDRTGNCPAENAWHALDCLRLTLTDAELQNGVVPPDAELARRRDLTTTPEAR
jgi:hypothetical protein